MPSPCLRALLLAPVALLSLVASTACNRTCGTLEVGGDIATTYIDDGKALPITGKFRDFCRVRWTSGGGLGIPGSAGNRANTIFSLDSDLSWLGEDEATFDYSFSSRNHSKDWNVALWWWMDAAIPLRLVVEDEVIDASEYGPGLYYDPIISAGDGFEGELPVYMGGATEGSMTIDRIRLPEGGCDESPMRVDVEVTYDYTWGDPDGDEPWAVSKGQDWWSFHEPEYYCATMAKPAE